VAAVVGSARTRKDRLGSRWMQPSATKKRELEGSRSQSAVPGNRKPTRWKVAVEPPDAEKSVEELSRSELSAPARLAVRKELARLKTLLSEDEEVLCLARGAYRGRFGLIAVSRKRLLFVDRARIHSQTASFGLARVVKVERGVTLMGYGRLVVYISTEDMAPASPLSKPPTVLKFKVLPKDHTEHLANAITGAAGIAHASLLEEVYDDRGSVEADSPSAFQDAGSGLGAGSGESPEQGSDTTEESSETA
jgi:hypothetical protein